MKKVSMLMLAVLSLTLFSFIAADNGVTRTGANLYTITATARLSQAEKDVISSAIKTAYKLTDADMQKGVVLSSISLKGHWIFTKTAWRNYFDHTLIYSDARLGNPESVQKVDAILTQYAPR